MGNYLKKLSIKNKIQKKKKKNQGPEKYSLEQLL